MFELLIRDGLIVDGSGNPGYYADLGVVGDRIAAIGRFPQAEAVRVIDAEKKVLCPGFIDAHSHSELEMLAGRHTAGVQMGVTTEFTGPDGFSFAPLPPQRLSEYRQYVLGVYGDPDVGWDWRTLPEYLERFDGQIYNNVAAQVPHGVIRLAVMGWSPCLPTEEELGTMCQLTRECMEAGAVALSTGLDYAPAAHAGTDELIALCRTVAEYGGVYVTHMRGYGDAERFDAIGETVTIAREAGIGVHINHFASTTTDHYAEAEAARARGVDITWDAYSYPAGSTTLAFVLPRTQQTTNVASFMDELRDPALRQLLRPDIEAAFPEGSRAYFASLSRPENQWMEGQRLRDVWRDSGKPLADFVVDLLMEESLAPLLVYPWAGTEEENEAALRRTLTHPLQMVITDGVYLGRYPNPRGWGTYPRILGRYVREQGWLRLEDAIRRMTSFPAMRFGLDDRGLLRKGMAADLVVFDPETIEARATYEEPRNPPVGLEHVLVNGVAVVKNGALTDRRPGRILRLH